MPVLLFFFIRIIAFSLFSLKVSFCEEYQESAIVSYVGACLHVSFAILFILFLASRNVPLSPDSGADGAGADGAGADGAGADGAGDDGAGDDDFFEIFDILFLFIEFLGEEASKLFFLAGFGNIFFDLILFLFF
jgi:hypothetical protein